MLQLRNVILAVLTTAALAGCNSYSYKPVDTGSAREKVRLVTITDSDGAIVGEKYEMLDGSTNAWFEAEQQSNGRWDLTTSGKRAKTAAQTSSSSSDGGSGGGGSC